MSELTTAAIIVGILTSAIRLATPYLYAAIGEAITEMSGVVNLGVEGVMLVSGFGAFYVALMTGNLWLGLLAALVLGL
jgi:general nucleoside transport system permease protein